MAKSKVETKPEEEKAIEPEVSEIKETKPKKVVKKSENTKPKGKTATKKKTDTNQETKTVSKKKTKTTTKTGTTKKSSSNEASKEAAKKTSKTSKDSKIKETKKTVPNKKSEATAPKNNSKETTFETNKENVTQKEIEKKEHLEIEEQEELQVQPKEEVIQIKEIKKEIQKKKVLPKEKREKIYGSLFRNIAVAGVIILYFIFLNLGKLNIKPDVYVTDLKVFSMCILATAIAIIENAYKKDSGELALYGVETIVLALSTVALIYVELMLSSKYVFIVTAMSYLFAIYYVIKSIVIYIKKRKKYFVDNMKEIIKEEE